MYKFANLPANDRADLFRSTAQQMDVHESIIEKDFWVCWVLDALFTSSQWKDKIIFKGGTSLSKVFKLISRFSEDIDLILDWRLLGYSKEEAWKVRSNTAQDKFCKEVNAKAEVFLSSEFIPAFKNELGSRLTIDCEIKAQDGVVSISYPKSFIYAYIQPTIRLEIGPLAEWIPHDQFEIKPYVAEIYPNLFTKQSTYVKAILAERTFWEKATILHQQAMQEKINLRYSRHYYDLYMICQTTVKDKAFTNIKLLDDVVAFKETFYRSAKAHYELAKPGTLKLLPSDDLHPELASDYKKMEEMIFGTPPTFESIIETLKSLEQEINTLSTEPAASAALS